MPYIGNTIEQPKKGIVVVEVARGQQILGSEA